MSNEKDENVISAAKVLREFLNIADVPWDEAFFRYVEYDDHKGYISSQVTYRTGRELEFTNFDREVENKYSEELRELLGTVFEFIVKEGTERPCVGVIRVTPAGEYKLAFGYGGDTKAMDISIMALGTKNSFFKDGEIDIPEGL